MPWTNKFTFFTGNTIETAITGVEAVETLKESGIERQILEAGEKSYWDLLVFQYSEATDIGVAKSTVALRDESLN